MIQFVVVTMVPGETKKRKPLASSDEKALLARLIDEVHQINQKLGKVLNTQEYKMEKATADDLSNETKRLRAVESASANQLVRMGFISKKREGRKVYFYIK